MEGISDIRIIGIDDKRPPKIRKEPYIDLIFKLSHKVPADWCRDFNALLVKHPAGPKIKEKEGLFIEAWVRTPDEISVFLEQLKVKVAECNRKYIERIERSIRNADSDNTSLAKESGEQSRLNRIIAELNFEDIKTD